MPWERISHYATYLGYRAFEGLLNILPLSCVFAAGKLCGWVSYYLLGHYRKLTQRNIRHAFGEEKSQREIHALAHHAFTTLGANLLSSIKLSTMSEEAINKHIEFDGKENISNCIEQGRGFIFLIGHLGAWEILAHINAITTETRRATLYRPLSNPYLNAHILRRRERTGLKAFDRKDGFNAPITHLRKGGTIGILIDQHAGDRGHWCPFFGRLASTSSLAPLMAERTGVAMFPLSIMTVGHARWKMRIGKPIEPGQGQSLATTTAQLNLLMEEIIRQSPRDWFWVHNRWKTPTPKFLLTKYRRGYSLPPDMSEAELKPFRILVRSPNPLGDACMSVPAIRAIKRGRPDTEITVLCPENLTTFWQEEEHVDHVISRSRSASNRSVAKVLRAAGPFDVAILLPNSIRCAIEARKAGIPHIVGYPSKWRNWMIHQLIAPRNTATGPRPHHITHYLKIAETIGADLADQTIFDPPAAKPKPDTGRIAISAGADYGPSKCWPADRFIATANHITEKHPDAHFVLLGTKSEESIGKHIADELGARCSDMTGKTNLSSLMDELRRCVLLITNDTGSMHLAAHLGIPTVAIFGSTEPAWTGPLGKGHEVIRHHVPCSPCFLRQCPMDFSCMTKITPLDVAGAVDDVFGRLA
ncbi:MAG: lipopolysaccharide heptosyltransferase II [Verrucomicrobiaceae bacterium]|nr:lipopolysaccharide heptosyltransferase II [Verrucomicrobiaceae bacterium]